MLESEASFHVTFRSSSPPDSLPKAFWWLCANAPQYHTPCWLPIAQACGFFQDCGCRLNLCKFKDCPTHYGGQERHPLPEIKQCSVTWPYAVSFPQTSVSVLLSTFCNSPKHGKYWTVMFRKVYWRLGNNWKTHKGKGKLQPGHRTR